MPLKHAEIVISAVGLPKHFKADQFGSQQIIVDVGINRDEAGKLCGDIDFASFEQAFEKCPRITPVPGGVGVLTTTLLMSNTVKAYHLQNKKD
jgi:methylenetetrahydrofolate dehydrogenase (NADP+)/methenyltetrahydrofolate cyclohydrolase